MVEVKHSYFSSYNGQKVNVAECLFADETSSINARFIGGTFPYSFLYLFINIDYTDIIQKDVVLAIRNGLMQLADESMRLSIDQFGKLTVEEDHQID